MCAKRGKRAQSQTAQRKPYWRAGCWFSLLLLRPNYQSVQSGTFMSSKNPLESATRYSISRHHGRILAKIPSKYIRWWKFFKVRKVIRSIHSLGACCMLFNANHSKSAFHNARRGHFIELRYSSGNGKRTTVAVCSKNALRNYNAQHGAAHDARRFQNGVLLWCPLGSEIFNEPAKRRQTATGCFRTNAADTKETYSNAWPGI